MREFIEVLLAVWPWWSGILLGIWWASLIEAAKSAPEDDPLAPSRGCVTALTFMATVVWSVFVIRWLLGLS